MALKIEILHHIEEGKLNYLDIHVHVVFNNHFSALGGHVSLQQPRRSLLTSKLNSVTSKTYVAMAF